MDKNAILQDLLKHLSYCKKALKNSRDPSYTEGKIHGLRVAIIAIDPTFYSNMPLEQK